MLGRGLAAVGLALGTADVLGTALTTAPGASTEDAALLTAIPATPTTETPTTETTTTETTTAAPSLPSSGVVADSLPGTTPDAGNSVLLVAIAIGAALGAAVLGWLGWRSR